MNKKLTVFFILMTVLVSVLNMPFATCCVKAFGIIILTVNIRALNVKKQVADNNVAIAEMPC